MQSAANLPPRLLQDLARALESAGAGPVAWAGPGGSHFHALSGHSFPDLEELCQASLTSSELLSRAVGWYASRRLEGLSAPLTVVIDEHLDGTLLERLEPMAYRGDNLLLLLVDPGRRYAPGGSSWLPFGLDARRDHLGAFLEPLGVKFLGVAELTRPERLGRELESALGRPGVRLLHLVGKPQASGADTTLRPGEHFYLARSPARGPSESSAVQTRRAVLADSLEQSLMARLSADLRSDEGSVLLWSRSQAPGSLALLGPRLLRRAPQGVLEEARGVSAAGQYPLVALSARALPGLMNQLLEGLDFPATLLVMGGGLSFSAGESRLSPGARRDLALLRMVPNLQIACPADEAEALELIRAARAQDKPVAVRFTSCPAVGVGDSRLNLAPGQCRQLRKGRNLALIALGSTVFPCILAAESLSAWGVDAAVFDARFVRPLDPEMLRQAAPCERILTVEEHCLEGGLGTAVLESMRALGLDQVVVRSLGLPEHEAVAVGSTPEQYGLHAEGIQRAAAQVMGLNREWG